MKIEVLKDWGMGYSMRVLPGVYDIDDERLFGYGQYLVDNGHAIVADVTPPVVPPVRDGEPKQPKQVEPEQPIPEQPKPEQPKQPEPERTEQRRTRSRANA